MGLTVRFPDPHDRDWCFIYREPDHYVGTAMRKRKSEEWGFSKLAQDLSHRQKQQVMHLIWEERRKGAEV